MIQWGSYWWLVARFLQVSKANNPISPVDIHMTWIYSIELQRSVNVKQQTFGRISPPSRCRSTFSDDSLSGPKIVVMLPHVRDKCHIWWMDPSGAFMAPASGAARRRLAFVRIDWSWTIALTILRQQRVGNHGSYQFWWPGSLLCCRPTWAGLLPPEFGDGG